MPCAPSHRPRAAAPPALLLLSLLSLAAGGCFSKPASLGVPLRYRPTSQMNMNTFAGELPRASVYVAPVSDVRDEPERIGENLENEHPIPIRAAGGGSGPAQFVHGVMRDLLADAGVTLAHDRGIADRVLVTELRRFWTRETTTYETEVRATVTVQDAQGRQLWQGMMNGTAERFGRSLKPENYQEVFSDAMIELVEGLLNNPGFRAALRGEARAIEMGAARMEDGE